MNESSRIPWERLIISRLEEKLGNLTGRITMEALLRSSPDRSRKVETVKWESKQASYTALISREGGRVSPIHFRADFSKGGQRDEIEIAFAAEGRVSEISLSGRSIQVLGDLVPPDTHTCMISFERGEGGKIGLRILKRRAYPHPFGWGNEEERKAINPSDILADRVVERILTRSFPLE